MLNEYKIVILNIYQGLLYIKPYNMHCDPYHLSNTIAVVCWLSGVQDKNANTIILVKGNGEPG